MDYSKATLEELDSLTQNDLRYLTEEEFITYYKRSVKLDNIYMFNGIAGHDMTSTWYGTSINKIDMNDDGKWVILQGYGIMAKFDLKPLMVNKKVFSEKMKALGVPDKILQEFYSLKEEILD